MSTNIHQIPASGQSKACTVGVIMLIAFAGPAVGLGLASRGVVLAPPWTFLTGLIYLLMACLGLPVGIVAVLIRCIKTRWLIVALTVAGVVAFFYLVILGPWVPNGMTNCQSVPSPLPQVRYTCVSESSDNTSYRYEFRLEGRAGWPVMQMVPQQR